MTKRDYYEVLGISKDASKKEMKDAFRSLARKFHPDKNPNADADNKFKEIQEAYAVLSDDSKKRQYDRYGHDGPADFFGPGGFSGVDISLEDLFGGGFESLFSGIFGGGSPFGGGGRQRSRRGNDLLLRHKIPFEVIVNGGEVELDAELLESCDSCNGTGSANPDDITTCSTCRGAGRVNQTRQMGGFIQQTVRECPDCNGVGKDIGQLCRPCRGEGRIRVSKTLKLTIPAGAETGNRLRIRGKGEQVRGGGTPGDLLVELDVESHPWLERDGADLLMALPLGYPDLLLGCTVEVPHLNEKSVKVKVAANSLPRDTVVVRGEGLPSSRGTGKGDLIVALKLVHPKKLSKENKKLVDGLRKPLGSKTDDITSLLVTEAESRRRRGY